MNRHVVVDGQPVTVRGFYEAVSPSAAEYPGFTMQVNSVGPVVVGWISQVPSFINPVAGVKSFPSLGGARCGYLTFTGLLLSAGVILGGDRPRDLLGGQPTSGVYTIDISIIDNPAPPEGINVYDPSKFGEGRPGALRIECKIDGPDFGLPVSTPHPDIPALRRWQVTGICFDATRGAKTFDPVRIVEHRPRLPYSHIETVASSSDNDLEKVRDALVASHVDPLPEPFVVQLLSRVTKLRLTRGGDTFFEPTPNDPFAEQAIKNWQTAAPLARAEKRRDLLRLIGQFASDIGALPHEHHREMVTAMFVDHSNFATRDDGRAYYNVYMQAIAEELGDKPIVGRDSPLYPILARGLFPNAPAGGKVCYRYTLSFAEVGDSNALLAVAAKFFWWAKVLPVAIGFAQFDVKCERVELELDEKGASKIDAISGQPIVKQALGTVYDSTKESNVRYTALTFTVGLFPRLPGAIEMFSLIGDVQYGDFGEARFNFGWGKLLKDIELGPYATITPPETGFLEITLPRRGGYTLFGSTTKIIDYKNKVADSFKEFVGAGPLKKGKMVKPFAEDVIKKGVHSAAEGWLDTLGMKGFMGKLTESLSPGTISIGGGYIWEPTRRADVTLPSATAQEVETVDVGASYSTQIAYFGQDKADIDSIIQNVDFNGWWGLSLRVMVEFFLAKYLALIGNPCATVELDGHASPEGPVGPLPRGKFDPYNTELSLSRLEGVSQAMEDAMDGDGDYAPDAWARIIMTEHGEEVARDGGPDGGGLEDPPGTANPVAFRDWMKQHKSEYIKWPFWRRVDARIGGMLVMRLCD
jgi:hypothetical protein